MKIFIEIENELYLVAEIPTPAPAPGVDVLRDWLALGEDVEFCSECRGECVTADERCRDCGYTPEIDDAPEPVEPCEICGGDFLTARGWCRDCGRTPGVES